MHFCCTCFQILQDYIKIFLTLVFPPTRFICDIKNTEKSGSCTSTVKQRLKSESSPRTSIARQVHVKLTNFSPSHSDFEQRFRIFHFHHRFTGYARILCERGFTSSHSVPSLQVRTRFNLDQYPSRSIWK